MRQTITGLVAGAALAVTMSVAPASACAVVDPCSPYYQGGYHGSYHAYGYTTERLPDPQGPQYYYVNQGPLYSGPGNLAPAPTYQERAVNGWQGYERPYRYRYNGGPYGNATNHLYDGARVHGPAVYSYRPRRTHFRPRRPVAPKYYYTARPGARYGAVARPGLSPRHGYAPRFYGQHPMAHGPRVHNSPHYAGPRPAVPRLTKRGSVTKPQI